VNIEGASEITTFETLWVALNNNLTSEMAMKKVTHFMSLLFCILGLTGNGFMGFAYAEGNAVEPISNGLSLRWGSNEIRQKFGDPKPTWTSCEMGYVGFQFEKCYGPGSSRLFIDGPDVRLSSGIGVGSSKADVERVFSNWAGATMGPYKLEFSYNGDRLSKIRIDYDASVDSAGGQAPASGGSSKSSGLAGMYWCVAPSFSSGTINLLPNGTYQMNGMNGGSYKITQGQVHFDGTLKDWNNGVALVENGNLIFRWQNSDGSKQYFAYRKGGN